ncbi:Rossmann-like and DUF2520 domain-containing protein [Flagellimonas olearia]|uniref:DUF2520 domain-containing protein n=1 Tax=Flagellimonas olearia TaxID=552546 RepID=A0A444VKQ4_9FLAO|nr:Rossmann-like and DUF2520 domain-containing protein [Allomuricauda olearia]RYC51363.1 hypothetical protein DN53_14285 [Allomuricauda olearia]
MLSVVILGTGNLAKHLFTAITETDGAQVVQVVGRNRDRLKWFSEKTAISNDFSSVVEADVYLIAVKDDAITEVSQALSHKEGVVAHTSGAVSLTAIAAERKGVFYPLQTFTEGKKLDFKSIPLCIEGSSPEDTLVLQKLANGLSDNVQQIDSDQRKKLHLAAVFVNNFTNHLFGVGEEICLENQLSFDLLKPLIKETAEKVQSMSPKMAQTGPARRGDQKSMQEHLKLLKNKNQIALYTLCSEAIENAYEKEL